MCLSLYDYQAKACRYRKGLTYLKNGATTNQNQTLHSQKVKRRGQRHKIKGNHTKNKERKKGETRVKMAINGKTRFKMAINTYLLIINIDTKILNKVLATQTV